MGICEQIHDHIPDPLDFVIGVYRFHDKVKLSEDEINRLRFHEIAVHGIPIEVLARANLFQNDMALNQ